jgi:hypothetical protein
MAKYSKKAQDKVEKSMHEYKHGELKSGSGAKVKNRKQAIAIGLSEAREAGAKVPSKSSTAKKSTTSSTRKTARRKSTTKKAATKKSSSRKKS